MTVNELLLKLHLPSIVAHFGWEQPKYYRKLNGFGWHAMSQNEDLVFNGLDLFQYNTPNLPKDDDCEVIKQCYRFYTQEHKELLEIPIDYSETNECKLVKNYLSKITNERFYRACRAEALTGNVIYNARTYKFADLLEELGMHYFINSGIGIINKRIVTSPEFAGLCLANKINHNIILIPSFYAPGKLASLEVSPLGDLSTRQMIYLNHEMGWYGQAGTNIVGQLRDLLTQDGCTWCPKLANWMDDRVLNLHHSLQPKQCIEIWTNLSNLVTNKDPLTLIDKNKLAEHLKDNISSLTIAQIRQLEKATNQELKKLWLSQKTSEATVAGYRFISNNGRYYLVRGNSQLEFTNFIVELTKIKKEEEFYQYGFLLMNDESVPFRLKRRFFNHQYSLINALTDIALEHGLGIPQVVPNWKNYLPNVINAFNPVNLVEKSRPVIQPVGLALDEL